MTPADAHAALLALPRFATAGHTAYRPGLARMRALLADMGDPHLAAPVVHIAGTNGKGSTASMVAAIGTAAGLRVGLHTSPHLLRVTERLRLDGTPAPDAWLAQTVERFLPVFERIGPSFFEATTALAFRYFADERVGLAVIEVGLGGRLDATNVVEPVVCGVTSVSLDHTDLLGATVEEIAREKGGIAKRGIPLLTTADASAARELRACAGEVAAPFEDVRASCRLIERGGGALELETPTSRYRPLELGLNGMHQRWNAALAVRLAEHAFSPSEQDVLRGLAETPELSGLRGRAEVLRQHPLVMADVAHNPAGLQAAVQAARDRTGLEGRLVVLLGFMRDKDAAAAADLLRRADAVWTVTLPGDRAHSDQSLASALRAAGCAADPVGSVQAGYERFCAEESKGSALLITGSHGAVEAAMRTGGFH